MAGVDYLAQLAGAEASHSVYVELVSGRWARWQVDDVWDNVAEQLQAVKRGDPVALERPGDVLFAELCYKQVTGGSVDVLVRFDGARPGAYPPGHDAILRLYLGQRRRRTWHLAGNVATFTVLMDLEAPLRNPTTSLFAHQANKVISELAQSAAGLALGSPERQALFAPLLRMVQHRLPSVVDETGRTQMEAVVLDLIDRAA